MTKEDKAKEIIKAKYKLFRNKVGDEPFLPAFTFSEGFKAGYEAGERKEIIEKLKESLNQKIHFVNLIGAKDFVKGIECALEELENLSK